MSWNNKTKKWKVITENNKSYYSSILISGQGGLHIPNYPNISGFNKYKGKYCHTAEWDNTYDYTGKIVGIIGSAASAVQAIPELAKKVKHLYVFQRTPNWVTPKLDGKYSKIGRFFLNFSICSKILRLTYYWRQEVLLYFIFNPNRYSSKLITYLMKRFIRYQISDKEIAEKLIPSYPMGCKRILLSNNYYPALNKDNVTVIFDKIDSITENGIKTIKNEILLDTIIYATGFKVLKGFAPIYNNDNHELIYDIWGDTPSAYLGITYPTFPNLFFLLGPNTALGHNSVVWMIECQVNYIIKCIYFMLNNNIKSLDIKQKSFDTYQKNIENKLKTTVWSSNNCSSWYQNTKGKVYTLWPSYTFKYWKDTYIPNFKDYNIEY